MLAPHLGAFWKSLGEEYPSARGRAFPMIVERFDGKAVNALDFEMLDKPPLARVWSSTVRATNSSRFSERGCLFNWRRVQPADDYRTYEQVKTGFLRHLGEFRAFVKDNSLGDVVINQQELTYIDHIPNGTVDGLAKVSGLFPGLSWAVNVDARFARAVFNIRTSFALPEEGGRLHVNVRTATRAADGQPLILLEMTARGIGAAADDNGLSQWFDHAHEATLNMFWDLTSDDVRKRVLGETE